MKKIISFILIFSLLLSLCGCSNENDKKASEEKPNIFLYYIDEMTPEKIAKECEYYYMNIPYEGETYEEYLSTFKAKPANDFKENSHRFYTDSFGDFQPPTRDVIRTITVSGILPQMDGTIGYNESDNTEIDVIVELWIKDYDRAEKVYNLLFDYLSPHYSFNKFNQPVDYRETTYWHAEGSQRVEASELVNKIDFLTMETYEDFYVIKSTYCNFLNLDDKNDNNNLDR